MNAVEGLANRREHPRSDLVVSVRAPGEATAESWMSTRDLSAGGMRLLSDRALLKGDRLALEILLPDGSWLQVTTKVAWSVQMDVGATSAYEVGLRFIDLDAEGQARLLPLLPQSSGIHGDGGRRES